jgi:hypothetical protein
VAARFIHHVKGVGKVMEHSEIEELNVFVLATLKELQLATLNVPLFVYTL